MNAGIMRIRDRASDRLEFWLARLTARTGPRSRLSGALVIVLGLHVLMFWLLISARMQPWTIPEPIEDDFVPVDIWDVPQMREPEPVPEVQPVVTPRQVQPRDVPEQVSEAPQQAQPAPPAALPQPVPQPVAQPQTVKPITVTIPKDAPLDRAGPATVADAPARPNIGTKVKKKVQDEMQARSEESIGSVTDLNLHETPAQSAPALAKVPPSGLAPAGGGGGRLGTMPQGLPNGVGTLKGGRGQVTQALQNHDWCVSTQKAGKPLPDDCQMTDLASQRPLGPPADPSLQATVAAKDRNMRYKTQPGNSAYWDRVNHVPNVRDHTDIAPQPGAYSNAKDQRNMGNGGGTADPDGDKK